METSVYSAICGIQSDLAKQGITKDQENKFDHYKFRGIDDIYNAMAPLLSKHKLCILPRMLQRTCEERQSKKGDPLFYVTVDAEFDFVSADNADSRHTVKVYGEAMDRSDKATNKAMSAAYKYACFQTFCIPTEGDNDADGNTPQPKADTKPPAKPPEKPAKAKTPMQEYLDSMAKAKAYLNKLTGNDDMYYEGLKVYQVKHANEIKDISGEGQELLKDLRNFAKAKKKDIENEQNTEASQTPGNDGKEFPPSES